MKKIVLLIISVLFLTGCNGAFNAEGCSPGFHEQNNLCVQDFDYEGSFESGEDVVNMFLTHTKKQNLLSQRFGFRFFGVSDLAMESDGLEYKATDSGSNDYSETNNQVEGVDEMDNVLTDGKYIYISNYDKVQIVLAYTQAAEYEVLDIVKEIKFDDLTPQNGNFYFNGMYVDDDRFIVVGTEYRYFCSSNEETTKEPVDEGTIDSDYEYCRYHEYYNTTHVWEYSKDDFKVVNEYQLSGSFVGSRKINEDLYFVTNEYIPYYYLEVEDLNFNIDNYLPNYNVNGTQVDLLYSEVMYIDGTEPTSFTTFYGINLDTKEVSTEVVLGEGGYNLYVSNSNIYLTGTKWTYDEEFILELEKADSVDDVEYEGNPYEIETSIIKVEIHDGMVEFSAEGSVPGMGLDQFAMDENGDYIRIVTTTNNWWWWGTSNEINNRLIILNMDLEIISTLEGIGKEGESVQSTRFVGDYAYVVTFLRTDPFYVIDLSDPENPTKLSELEVTGFSDYLQPIGEDYILGIGYGDLDGGTQGLKISLYDVSDKNNAIVASEIIYPYEDNGYIWTSTVYNHKDLLVSLSKGIIALPYTEYEWGNVSTDYHWTYHTGVLVLNLDVENGLISEKAIVEHSEAGYHDIYVYKSKFIDEYLYTISSKYIKVSTIEDPSTILDTLEIGESRQYYYGFEVLID
jgi:uncharacterized secreted protein with C-terminal beta-propeller domain